jgi:LacI family transcriptional regulator
MVQKLTVADIAKLADVSAMTVSRVLSGRGSVAKKTRERVLAIVKENDFIPNINARGLAGNRTNILGMLIPDLNTQYISELARGASLTASQNGFDFVIYPTPHDTQADHERLAKIGRNITDGLLIVLPQTSEAYLSSLKRSGLDMVIIDHRGESSQFPSVAANNYNGARQAVDHLITLGHTRIGFITGRMDTYASRERLRGYREGLLTKGIQPQEELIAIGDFQQTRGFEATKELLSLPEPPTAIFASNDVSAFGALDAAKSLGLRVPEDISIVGFDDIPMSSYVHPALTTVRQPLFEMGVTATKLLISMLAKIELPTEHIELPTQFIIRASTATALK